MAYSRFTLSEVQGKFGLTFAPSRSLFSAIAPVSPSDLLQTLLEENTPLALAMRTEKARSEFLIAPILAEIKRRATSSVSLFSGAEFNVTPRDGLNGECDFLLTRSPQQFYIESPIIAVAEAKRDDVVSGFGQCVATLVAAQRFNTKEKTVEPVLWGVATTGDIWKFISLEESVITIDADTYYLDKIAHILGILLHIAR
jgi:hypothetical protein